MSRLEQLKQKMSYQTLLLAGFALLVSTLLGAADLQTRDEIEKRLQEDLQSLLADVAPANLYDNQLLNSTVVIDETTALLGQHQTKVYLAKKQGQLTAVAFSLIATGGYSGDIHLIMGIDVDGNVLGVRVVSHAETPGLGDKIEVAKSDWITRFNQHSLTTLRKKQWGVKKDGGVFDQFSGATITPRALVKGVYNGLQFFQQYKPLFQGKSKRTD